MLDAVKLGFSTMGVSFYQKPEKPQKNRVTIIEKTAVKV